MPEPQLDIPDDFRARVRQFGRREWLQWLEDLPELVATYLGRWELEEDGRLPLSWTYVLPVRRANGQACVLKLQPRAQPDDEGAIREMRALRLAGAAAVTVVEDDADEGVLLLERAMPGDSLVSACDVDDDSATETLSTVIQGFSHPVEPGHGLPPVGGLASAFERFDSGPHGDIARSKAASRADNGLIIRLGLDEQGSGLPALREARRTAERVLEELEADKSQEFLLHGDLHHDNVLQDEGRGWLVIDAKGFVGDAGYEVATAMHNPIRFVTAVEDLERLFSRRLSIFAGVLDLDRERITAWCYVNAVLSALWTIEDGGSLTDDAMIIRSVAALRTMI